MTIDPLPPDLQRTHGCGELRPAHANSRAVVMGWVARRRDFGSLNFIDLRGCYLKDRSISFQLQPRMVRGLDYYTRTTFEITHGALGAQNALLGGGRYDGLSEALGGPPAPGIGFSIGVDRFALAIGAVPNDLPLYIAWMGESAYRHAAAMARELRAQNVMVEIAADSVKLKKALELASRLRARSVLIIGDQELAEGRYPLRDMARGEQRIVTKPELFQQFAAPASAPLPSFAGAKPS